MAEKEKSEGRLRNKDKVDKAILTQDRLRSKSRGWKGAEEIRRWRGDLGWSS